MDCNITRHTASHIDHYNPDWSWRSGLISSWFRVLLTVTQVSYITYLCYLCCVCCDKFSLVFFDQGSLSKFFWGQTSTHNSVTGSLPLPLACEVLDRVFVHLNYSCLFLTLMGMVKTSAISSLLNGYFKSSHITKISLIRIDCLWHRAASHLGEH